VDGNAVEENVPLHREAILGPQNSHAAAKTYESFTAAASVSAACQQRVGGVSATVSPCASEARIDRLALHRQDAESTLVDAVQRVTAREPFE
jgi:hypothetical protein